MEYSPSRCNQSDYNPRRQSSKQPEMAMLAASPAPHAGFQKEYPWDTSRFPSYPLRQNSDSGPISLPSIRMAFPELHLPPSKPQGAAVYSTDPSSSPRASGVLASPVYVHTSVTHKRRRDSLDDDQERDRARQVPRLYHSIEQHAIQRASSPSHPPTNPETWIKPARTAPFSRGNMPLPMEVHERVESRSSHPGVPPPLVIERNPALRAPPRDHHVHEYRDHAPPPPSQQLTQQQQSNPPMESPSPRYASSNYEYSSYRQPGHMHSLSTSPIHGSYDRASFSAGGYSRPYPDYSGYPELGPITMSGDSKQRKRRGNLPKETTDKLRTWFMAHLSHPYPTEDEKQELMRQTGLQMNQISNWFINARRRQLPTMINNARVETDAMSSRAGDGNILPSTERHEIHVHGGKKSLTISDGDSGHYDEDIQRHRTAGIKRGSV